MYNDDYEYGQNNEIWMIWTNIIIDLNGIINMKDATYFWFPLTQQSKRGTVMKPAVSPVQVILFPLLSLSHFTWKLPAKTGRCLCWVLHSQAAVLPIALPKTLLSVKSLVTIKYPVFKLPSTYHSKVKIYLILYNQIIIFMNFKFKKIFTLSDL